SPASTQYLTDVVKINSQKVQLVMNGVAPRKDYSIEQIHKLKEDLHIKNDTIVIGSTGRMIDDNTKRFSDLIKAFKKIKANYSEVKLVLVGEGRLIEEYKKLAQSLEIQDDVIFTGYQKEVDLYYSLFDIFTLVSANESFGLVLAEAMLKKLPIVATKVGGMQFIVKDNETGFLVE
ncbi:glycosyltransferase, partial [Microcystis aeruginosa]|uniref:glycosyltransferase n=1 Tax=Microcystis aeruginosa TaxID=1126 RepID=UPI000AA8CC19